MLQPTVTKGPVLTPVPAEESGWTPSMQTMYVHSPILVPVFFLV